MSNEVIELKQQGNKLFSQRNYEEAISCYTKALVSVTQQIYLINMEYMSICLVTRTDILHYFLIQNLPGRLYPINGQIRSYHIRVQIITNVQSLPLPQVRDDRITTIYTNRALCYLKLELYDRVLRDCKLALEQDKLLTKAHFFMGQAYVEQGKFDEAIVCFTTGTLSHVLCVLLCVSVLVQATGITAIRLSRENKIAIEAITIHKHSFRDNYN